MVSFRIPQNHWFVREMVSKMYRILYFGCAETRRSNEGRDLCPVLRLSKSNTTTHGSFFLLLRHHRTMNCATEIRYCLTIVSNFELVTQRDHFITRKSDTLPYTADSNTSIHHAGHFFALVSVGALCCSR